MEAVSPRVDESIQLLYVTVGSRPEALKIARMVVEERLAACANITTGITSVYRWEGELCEEEECLVLLKTPAHQVQVLTERIVALHSYECPCVVSWPLNAGHAPFLAWVRSETKSRA